MDKKSCLPLFFTTDMIIDSSQSNVEVIGDVKEFKTSIDPKNLEYITTLLSSNLYSNPERSFIREIVSNAWDSHVEAGTTDVPVIIRFRNSDRSVTIRDYGTGLSPDRFKDVYCNIGSSTKRESNDFIGGFGIGKYSSLACSNTVYITSYYEGVAYYYIMVKSGNSITTNLVNEAPTSEKNGVEVTIRNVKYLTPFEDALRFVVFFPNIYIEGGNRTNIINKAKLKSFKHFAAASINIDHKLLLGNVLYPCDINLLSPHAVDFMYNISITGIVLKFDIGELDITPNRESLIYTEKTINRIEERIRLAKNEIESLINTKVSKDYDNIEEYCKLMSYSTYYNPVYDEINTISGYRIYPKDSDFISVTYKGKNIRDSIKRISGILGLELPNYKGVVYDDKIYKKSLPCRVIGKNRISSDKVLILNKEARMSEAVRLFLRDNYDGYSIMTDISNQEFRNYIENSFHPLSLPEEDNYDLIVDGIYDSLMKKAKRLDINTNSEFISFKHSLQDRKVNKTIKERETILYVFDNINFKKVRRFSRFSLAVNYIKSLKRGVIIDNMSGDEINIPRIASMRNYVYIKARKDIISDLKSLNLSCIIDTDWITNKDPILSIIYTVYKHFDSRFPEGVSSIINTVPHDVAKEFIELMNVYNKYVCNTHYRAVVKAAHPPVDMHTEYLCLKLKNYIEKYRKVKTIVKDSGFFDNTIITIATIIKTKSYRVSSEAYNIVKNNKILKILCRR